MKFKAVLFDLDGTLANSLQDLANATNFALKKHGYMEHNIEEYKLFVGDGIYKMIERAIPELKPEPKKVEEVKGDFFSYYSKHYADNTVFYDGMPELIDKIKRLGIKVAVVTNKAQNMADTVVKKLYGNKFDLILGQREGIPIKPDPTLALMAMKKLNVIPKECVFVGDSGMDVATGVNSGALPVGVLWGFRDKQELVSNGAKYTVSNIEELWNIIF